jgi:oxygen-independent coproporphyrinogen-3 oxidase
VSAGESPAQAREILTERQSRLERILLLTRLSGGCPLTELDQPGAEAARAAVADGLARPEAYRQGRVVLTQRGRLLADAVVRDLTG